MKQRGRPRKYPLEKPLTEVEIKRRFNDFKPRFYQLPILKALDSGFKRVLAILPRRAGKDVTALNYMIRQMYKTPGTYWLVYPSYAQGKKAIWDGYTNDGRRFLSYFPKELVLKTNAQEMKLLMVTESGAESAFQIIGSDHFDKLVGSNPRGIIFSEYALQDPRAFQYLNPILVANDGWALFISTPRGKNHLYSLAQVAKASPDWFFYHLTIEDTKHIPLEKIEKERQQGIMSEDLIQQEYFTSFDMGVEGSFYAKYIENLHRENRIGAVPWENSLPVHTVWDIGVRDSTAIIFFQIACQTVRLINCYENSKKGLEHYVNFLFNLPYTYGTHIAPWDIATREWTTNHTRLEKARQLGVEFIVGKKHELHDGIESGRSLFSKLWIDKEGCKPLIHALENYRQSYDHKYKVYRSKPLHDWTSHFADAYRYLATNLHRIGRSSLTAEELDKRYRASVFGGQSNLPEFFNDNYASPWGGF